MLIIIRERRKRRGSAAVTADRVHVEAVITIGLMFNVTFKPGIECCQLVKRHRRQAVMRGVIRHVPGQYHDKRLVRIVRLLRSISGSWGQPVCSASRKSRRKGCPNTRQQPELNQLRCGKHPTKAQKNDIKRQHQPCFLLNLFAGSIGDVP